MPVLAHTTADIMEREALRINPAKTCQPIGAMYAALGIHGCLPHSHGSQGCCSYHRSHLTRHYKEPVMASTSSFTEGASVFGGAPNLRQALKTIFDVYSPDGVAVHTTCLSETIGDDIPSIIKKARDEGIIPEDKWVIHTNTPSYIGSHVTGFANMVKGMIGYFADRTGQKVRAGLNVIPGYVEPSDMKEIKHILAELSVPATVFPDTSGVLDGPQTGEYRMFPPGGAKVEDIVQSGENKATLALGPFASEPGAADLKNKCGVPFRTLDLPIGVEKNRPVCRFADRPDGSHPVPGADPGPGTVGGHDDRLSALPLWKESGPVRRPGPDALPDRFYLLHGHETGLRHHRDAGQAFRKTHEDDPGKIRDLRLPIPGRFRPFLSSSVDQEPPGGPPDRKYLRKAHRPGRRHPHGPVRFPILDRAGHADFPTVGYRGGIRLLVSIVNTLLDRADRDAPDEQFELVM